MLCLFLFTINNRVNNRVLASMINIHVVKKKSMIINYYDYEPFLDLQATFIL